MIKLKIYGKPSSTYAYMKNAIIRISEQANIEVKLEEITDTQSFIDNQVMSIPAYQLNGKIEEINQKDIQQFISELQLSLLKKANFGNMKKIFVPVNFKDASDNAVFYAINMSKYFNAAIKLVHAYRPTPVEGDLSYLDPADRADRLEELNYLTDELNKKWLGDTNPPVVDGEIVSGFAIDAIQKISEQHPKDWIVMASTNSSKRVKKLFGSVSTDIAKNAASPVFIIPPNVEFSPLKKIAFCSSDPSLDIEVIDELVQIAEAFDSEIHVIHVNEKASYVEFDLLNAMRNKYPKEKLKLKYLAGDNRVETVNNYCQENNIDLLSMARRKRSLINELVHKSFTKEMTITTKLPLLVLHK